MKEIEAARLKLKCLEIVEGTDLKWFEVLRGSKSKVEYFHPPLLNNALDHYEVALGILEGKPVWNGDTLYNESGEPIKAYKGLNFKYAKFWSWNPPKPKTVMVELPLDYVENQAALSKHQRIWPTILSKACAEALETEKDQEHKRLCNCV